MEKGERAKSPTAPSPPAPTPAENPPCRVLGQKPPVRTPPKTPSPPSTSANAAATRCHCPQAPDSPVGPWKCTQSRPETSGSPTNPSQLPAQRPLQRSERGSVWSDLPTANSSSRNRNLSDQIKKILFSSDSFTLTGLLERVPLCSLPTQAASSSATEEKQTFYSKDMLVHLPAGREEIHETTFKFSVY